MSFTPSSPLTGGPQVGLTSPTYTLTSDTPPNAHSVQYAVTALGGTQTGVTTHSVSSPFTLTAERPAQFRYLGVPNPVTGVIGNVPMNVTKVRVRKGVTPAANQAVRPAMAELKVSVPAGAETYDTVNVKAMLSACFGLVWAESSDIGAIPVDGIV